MGKEAMEKGTSSLLKQNKSKGHCLTGQGFRTAGNKKILTPQSSTRYMSRLSRKLQLVLYSHPNTSKELSRSQLHQPRRLALSSPDG